MKAILNVEGKQLEVVSIDYRNGEADSVMAVDDKGILKTYYNTSVTTYTENALKVDLKEALEFPFIEESIQSKFTKMIKYLEELIVDENDALTQLAVSAMEGEHLPFEGLSLADKQREYKLRQQRVEGVIDTVGEVKAFAKGWYADDDTPTEVEA